VLNYADLSFHAKALACIKKGKAGKEMEFGRVLQLGRIKGNFLFVLESRSIKMNDKQSFPDTMQQDEKRYSDLGRGVRVCLGPEFATNDSTSARENERCWLERFAREDGGDKKWG